MVGRSMSEIVLKDSGRGWFSENKGIYHGVEGANVGAISIVGPFAIVCKAQYPGRVSAI